MLACPHCRRRVFTRSVMVHSTIDGSVLCPICKRPARLDLLSRWMLCCIIALVLPAVLLSANVFYSGHVLIVSVLVVFVGSRVLCALALPLFALERTDSDSCMDRRQSMVTVIALLVAAVVMDGVIAMRIDRDSALESAGVSSMSCSDCANTQ